MKKTVFKLIFIVGIMAVAVWYYYYKYLPSTLPGGDVKPLNPDDKATYDAMISVFSANADPGALNWLLPNMKAEQQSGLPNDFLVGGQTTKSGLFLKVFEGQYYGYGYVFKDRPVALNGTNPGTPGTPATVTEDNTNKALFNLFCQLRNKYIINA